MPRRSLRLRSRNDSEATEEKAENLQTIVEEKNKTQSNTNISIPGSKTELPSVISDEEESDNVPEFIDNFCEERKEESSASSSSSTFEVEANVKPIVISDNDDDQDFDEDSDSDDIESYADNFADSLIERLSASKQEKSFSSPQKQKSFDQL